MQFADPARLGDEGLVGLTRELGLKLKNLVERAHADELLEEGPGLLERFPGKVTIGIRDRLKVDRARLCRPSQGGTGGCRRGNGNLSRGGRGADRLTNFLAALFPGNLQQIRLRFLLLSGLPVALLAFPARLLRLALALA